MTAKKSARAAGRAAGRAFAKAIAGGPVPEWMLVLLHPGERFVPCTDPYAAMVEQMAAAMRKDRRP